MNNAQTKNSFPLLTTLREQKAMQLKGSIAPNLAAQDPNKESLDYFIIKYD